MHAGSARTAAIQLRSQGYSYAYISEQLGLSKSTLSGWLHLVPYTPNKFTLETQGKSRAAAGARKAEIRLQSCKEIEEQAVIEIGQVSDRDLFMFGLGLYLGEGSKTNSIVRISNSDPNVIQAAVTWFRALGVQTSQFAPRIHQYPDGDIDASLQFWSQTTSIPKSQFLKTQIDFRIDKKRKSKGKLPYGTLHLGIRSEGRKEFGVAFSRKIASWNSALISEIKKRD